MSKVLRHPNGLYVQEWSTGYKVSRVELVPKAKASSYKNKIDASEAIAFFPGADMKLEIK